MKNLKQVIRIISYVIFVLILFTPFVYWVFNADMTMMQVFKKLWWLYFVSIIPALGTKYGLKKPTWRQQCRKAAKESRVSAIKGYRVVNEGYQPTDKLNTDNPPQEQISQNRLSTWVQQCREFNKSEKPKTAAYQPNVDNTTEPPKGTPENEFEYLKKEFETYKDLVPVIQIDFLLKKFKENRLTAEQVQYFLNKRIARTASSYVAEDKRINKTEEPKG